MTTAPCPSTRHDPAAYNSAECRCPVGRETWRLYRKRLREGRQPPAFIPGVGTARRLQALVAGGYCWRYLAGRLNVTPKRVRQLALQPNIKVGWATDRRVKSLLAELSKTPGPSKYARTVAARHGFVEFSAWDDGTIDDPTAKPWTSETDSEDDRIVDAEAIREALKGRRMQLTKPERHYAVHIGRDLGMTKQDIAVALHMSYDAVRTLAGKPVPEGYDLAGYELAA